MCREGLKIGGRALHQFRLTVQKKTKSFWRISALVYLLRKVLYREPFQQQKNKKIFNRKKKVALTALTPCCCTEDCVDCARARAKAKCCIFLGGGRGFRKFSAVEYLQCRVTMYRNLFYFIFTQQPFLFLFYIYHLFLYFTMSSHDVEDF